MPAEAVVLGNFNEPTEGAVLADVLLALVSTDLLTQVNSEVCSRLSEAPSSREGRECRVVSAGLLAMMPGGGS